MGSGPGSGGTRMGMGCSSSWRPLTEQEAEKSTLFGGRLVHLDTISRESHESSLKEFSSRFRTYRHLKYKTGYGRAT